jgi:hypothetical protein
MDPYLVRAYRLQNVQSAGCSLKNTGAAPTTANVEQVSLPMRIALLVVLAVAGLWLVILRPQPGADVAPAAPAVQAKQAPTAGKPDTAQAKAPAAKPQPKPAPAKAAKPKSTGAQVILDDLAAGKVVVALFYNRKLTDDREVRRAVDAVDRRDGKVAIRRISIADLGKYERITRGVPVVTSPSVLVIDRDRRARVIGGLTVTREIDQMVGRALSGK